MKLYLKRKKGFQDDYEGVISALDKHLQMIGKKVAHKVAGRNWQSTMPRKADGVGR